jgi:hypothetical protein
MALPTNDRMWHGERFYCVDGIPAEASPKVDHHARFQWLHTFPILLTPNMTHAFYCVPDSVTPDRT